MNNLMLKSVVAVCCIVLNPAFWYVNAAMHERSHIAAPLLCGTPGGSACDILAAHNAAP